jgi:precorrin-6B methylase 2
MASTLPSVAVYYSLSSEYERAFGVFLAHTDQKDKARAWLDQAVGRLPQRRVFIDAGAGNGKVTAWYTGQFQRTIAIEPNPHLRRQLEKACPAATVLPATILEAGRTAAADLVLASHVMYYIPGEAWLENLSRLASFLAPAGVLVVVLQNGDTDCMRLLEHFHARRFDLRPLGEAFEREHGGAFDWRLETVEAHVRTADLSAAYTVAEFMLNLLPMPKPPARSALEEYVRRHFAAPGGGFRFSCSQDFLVIQRRAT